MRIAANRIEIELEDSGETDRPVVLLIMGMGMQLISWPPGLVRALRHAGFRVIRFDNRDAGLSTRFAHAGVPNLLWQGFRSHFGFPSEPAYSVQDMALDALGVLDALHLQRAHVVGMSMGGMIAQRLALQAPERVASLCSIMSSSGAPDLPMPDAKVMQLLLGQACPAGLGGRCGPHPEIFERRVQPRIPARRWPAQNADHGQCGAQLPPRWHRSPNACGDDRYRAGKPIAPHHRAHAGDPWQGRPLGALCVR